jgi:hypothetical protein
MPAGCGWFAVEVNREALLMPTEVMFPPAPGMPIDNLGWPGSVPHHGLVGHMLRLEFRRSHFR